jgi:predicted nuclease of predicted toxin-antitoxin system
MRFLADENFPRLAVEALRVSGHDVTWVRIEGPGSTDLQVLDRARAEARILLTFDKDFGELVLKRGLGASHGVVLFRIPLEGPAEVARRVVEALGMRDDWAGHFSVVEKERVRMRALAR